jgi:hypothetical protein
MRRKIILTLAALTLVFAVPVAAETLGGNPPAHQACPAGIHVNIGGGSGNKEMMRRAVDWYNSLRAEQARPGSTGRSQWPSIRSVSYAPHDGIVTDKATCAIDFDERDLGNNGQGGFASLSWFNDTGHIIGCGIVMNASAWNGGVWSDQYAVTHELLHCLGLGHSSDPNSVMSYAYRCICLPYSDLSTLSHTLYPQGGHH